MLASKKLQNQKGFSLVELLVVFVIIGIVLAGASKGREIIRSQQIKSTISMVSSIERATNAFVLKFEVLPGDMPDPNASLPNCDSPPCTNAGNCNDRIASNPNEGTTPLSESAGFWAHLVAAGVFLGTEPNGGPTTAAYPAGTKLADIIGVVNPAAPMGGGLHIGYATTAIGTAAGLQFRVGTIAHEEGHYLAIKYNPSASTGGFPSKEGPKFKPAYAVRFDQAMDDGHPGKGRVLAAENDAVQDCADANEYSVNNNAIACALYVRLDIEVKRDPDDTGPMCLRRLETQ